MAFEFKERLAPKRCPSCASRLIAVEVVSWADFRNGEPVGFDAEDAAHVKVPQGASAVCRTCGHYWTPGERRRGEAA